MLLESVIEKQCQLLQQVEEAMRNVELSPRQELFFPVEMLFNKHRLQSRIIAGIPAETHDFIYTVRVNPPMEPETLADAYPEIKRMLRRDHIQISPFNKVHTKGCLFMGARRYNLRNVFYQHLGYGADRSFSLKLSHWLPAYFEGSVVLQWQTVKSQDISTSLPLLENGIWHELKPAFGKPPTVLAR